MGNNRSHFPTNTANTGSAPRGPVPNNPYGRPGGDDDFVIDLSGVDTSASPQNQFIEDGKHLFYVKGIEKTTSKAGNPMLVWDLTVLEGDYAGITKKVYTAITPNAMWKIYEMARATGFPLEMNDAGQPKPFKLGDLKTHAQNVILVGDVINETNDGNQYSSVRACYATDHIEPGTKRPATGVPR